MNRNLWMRGRYRVRVYQREGDIWVLQNNFAAFNGVPDAAINHAISVYLTAGGSQQAAWHFGLIDSLGFTALAAADTAVSHAGWSEFTGYNEATRPQWVPGAVAAKQVTNPNPGQFTLNTTRTLKGIFLQSDSAKSGTGGILFSTALFEGGDQTLFAGQVAKVFFDHSVSEG